MTEAVPLKVYEILKDIVEGDIQNYKITVNDPNKKGEGYLGQMFFVSLKDKGNGKSLDVVVKQAFCEKNIREFYPIRNVFLNEICFYTKLWPKLVNFQKTIPPSLQFVHLAKCLAAVSTENFEALVFANLKYDGFVLQNKKEALEKEKFEFIFKVYGKLHAISFAYKELYPEEFSKVSEEIIDVWVEFSRLQSFQEAIKMSHQYCLESLQPGVDDVIIEKYRHYVDDAVNLFHKSLDNGRYTCVIHGDCWSNNMMFKYDDDGNLVDLRLLDFQMFRVGSPVCDLSYCLYSGGTKAIFDDLDHFLQVYHDSLSVNLRAFGCEPNELYPLEALKNDWKVHCQLGVTMGLMIWRGKMTYEGDEIDLSDLSQGQGDVKLFFEGNYDKKTFQERTRDIVLHLYENDYMF